MSKRDYNSPSFLPKGCGCLVLLILLTPVIGVLVLSFFVCGSTNKAKQSEGKQYISSMNKGQLAYYAENSAFSNSVNALGLGLKTETTNYKYSLRATKQAAFNYGVSKHKTEKSYVGGVFLVDAGEAKTTYSILCEADSPGTIKPPEPIDQNGEVICGKGTTLVAK
ncbi:type IV pilin-like G/H family protein [Microcoleus sp. A2-C5]|uniref:type IV pilin-like G/H family protein n=1 Tax=unclassified Microcoleus TaxID=2642155 RepID=UPI002FD18BEC